jgi:hypothetical protein
MMSHYNTWQRENLQQLFSRKSKGRRKATFLPLIVPRGCGESRLCPGKNTAIFSLLVPVNVPIAVMVALVLVVVLIVPAGVLDAPPELLAALVGMLRESHAKAVPGILAGLVSGRVINPGVGGSLPVLAIFIAVAGALAAVAWRPAEA